MVSVEERLKLGRSIVETLSEKTGKDFDSSVFILLYVLSTMMRFEAVDKESYREGVELVARILNEIGDKMFDVNVAANDH